MVRSWQRWIRFVPELDVEWDVASHAARSEEEVVEIDEVRGNDTGAWQFGEGRGVWQESAYVMLPARGR
jgi:hypothetical protein